jgi:hypothetical protein
LPKLDVIGSAFAALNPVIARADGVLAVDAKVRLAPPPPRPDLLLRRPP